MSKFSTNNLQYTVYRQNVWTTVWSPVRSVVHVLVMMLFMVYMKCSLYRIRVDKQPFIT